MDKMIIRPEINELFKWDGTIQRSFIIYGHQGSGKTFILKYIYNEIEKRMQIRKNTIFIPIFIDAYKIGNDDIFITILNELINKISEISSIPNDIRKDYKKHFKFLLNKNNINNYDFETILTIIKQIMERYFNLKVVIIYDNLELCYPDTVQLQSLAYFRYLTSESKLVDSLFIIMSGGIKLFNLHTKGGSPLSNISGQVLLKPYEPSNVLKLFTSKGISNSKELTDLLYNEYGCHPLLINYLIEKEDKWINLNYEEKRDYIESIVENIAKTIFKDLNNIDINVFEIISLQGYLTEADLIKMGFRIKEQNHSLMNLQIYNLVRRTDETPNKYCLNGTIFANWLFNNDIGPIKSIICTGYPEMDRHLLHLLFNRKKKKSYELILDLSMLLNYFGNRYIVHTTTPEFLLNPSKIYLNKAKKEVVEGNRKKIRFEVEFFQAFIIVDILKDTKIGNKVHKEPEIHGGKEDFVFQNRASKIPIELKAIYDPKDRRDIKEIISNDYLKEIGQHSQNIGIGILSVLDFRNIEDIGGIEQNIYIENDVITNSEVFIFIFKKYDKPSNK